MTFLEVYGDLVEVAAFAGGWLVAMVTGHFFVAGMNS